MRNVNERKSVDSLKSDLLGGPLRWCGMWLGMDRDGYTYTRL
jgi:hypothetical protein